MANTYDDPKTEPEDPAGVDDKPEEVGPSGDEPKKTKGWAYDESSANLVEEFEKHPDGVECLKEICEKVCRDFDTDYEGSAERREQFKKDWAIFAGTLPKKMPPYDALANPHVPIAIENLS